MSDHFLWHRKRFINSPWVRYGILILAVGYFYIATQSITINPQRIIQGFPRAAKIFSSAIPPDFASRGWLIAKGFVESLQITIISTLIGVLLSLPLAVMASRNLTILPVYIIGRAIVITARSLHPVILGILFVKAVGFGVLAGTMTLIIYSIGFVGKLLAEAIEEIDKGQIEAIRATGAGYMKILVYAVFPQILPRYIGLSLYQIDINLRASAIIGIVGAGGIGSTLLNAFGRYDYGTASAILLVMIAIILVAEAVSGYLRRYTK